MQNLFIHNLKTGWRNIRKYKVQNTISVLCLVVGIICFGITLFLINSVLLKDYFKAEYVSLSHTKSPCTIAFADSVKQLPSVESVIYEVFHTVEEVTFRTPDGKEIVSGEDVEYISSDYLKEQGYYSVITGKPVTTLKAGTVIMDEGAYRHYSFRNVNPIGMSTTYGTVCDIVTTDRLNIVGRHIFVVVDSKSPEYVNPVLSTFYVRLSDDVDFEKFEKEIKAISPDYYAHASVPIWRDAPLLLLLLAVVFIGASLLIIGLSGFLKMQLQLFLLRSREMALRRCSGAHSHQLLWLYVAEVLIIAVITFFLLAVIAFAVIEYWVPYLEQTRYVGFANSVLFITCKIIPSIFIGTFLVAIALSWLSLRRMLSKPLSETVARSYAHKNAFGKTMQVTQYFVATILLSITLNCLVLSIQERDKYAGKEKYMEDLKKLAIYSNIALPGGVKHASEFNDDIKKIPSLDKVARFCYQYDYPEGMSKEDREKYLKRKQKEALSKRAENHSNEYVEMDIAKYLYDNRLGLYANPEIFSICNTKVFAEEINANRPDSVKIPVYAYSEEAAYMKKSLGLTCGVSNNIQLAPDILLAHIGYADVLPREKMSEYFGEKIDYYVVASDSMFKKVAEKESVKNEEAMKAAGREIHSSGFFTDFYQNSSFILKPKNGDVKQLIGDMEKVLDKHFPGYRDYHNISIRTAFDSWCPDYDNWQGVIVISFPFFLITILSIILTVYSSVSLETRGSQKEIAIRKVNGAKTKDIVILFSRHYIRTLAIAFALVFVVGVPLSIEAIVNDWSDLSILLVIFLAYLCAAFIITIVTALTIGKKILQVARTNAAEYLSYNK